VVAPFSVNRHLGQVQSKPTQTHWWATASTPTAATKVAAMPAKPDDASVADPSQPTYEQARDELVQIVAQLEAGGSTLEQSLALWQRGEDLAGLCERYLDAARVRLDAATGNTDADTRAG
jgi:exodeoxyribonuclease VII small subunit